ncbi:MAG: aldehyde dehydrogenase family protein [Deltaproteobacteria bacterium]|nr:aldehyde dehydrogenase family protein [Deltaproteobacteria bacterium]
MREFKMTIEAEAPPDAAPREIKSPYDGRCVGTVDFGGPQAVEAAIEAARRAAPKMATLSTHARVKILQGMAHALARRQDETAQIIADEAGKPIQYARAEAARCVDTFLEAAEQCKRLGGEYISIDAVPAGDGRYGVVRRFPLGSVAAISPFNFPLNLSAHKLAPAIAAGNSVVLKPASQTPMSSCVLAEAAAEAGLPAGALSVVPASREAANQLTVDERLALLTFTGSAEVGWAMKGRAGKKKVVLELGGNAAALVGPDADLQTTVPRLVIGAFAYAGQVCISVQRIFVHEPLAAAFIERFVETTQTLARTGDPDLPDVVVGPMIDRANAERIVAWIEEARGAGAQVLCGGETRDSCVTPAVLTGADPSLKIVAEEAFGPVVVIEPVKDWDEAIARTNDSRFGLQCGVFTNDLKAAWRCFEQIEVGGVIHNDFPTFRVDHMPYGGVKDSGCGREGPRYAIEEMSEPRLLVLNP